MNFSVSHYENLFREVFDLGEILKVDILGPDDGFVKHGRGQNDAVGHGKLMLPAQSGGIHGPPG